MLPPPRFERPHGARESNTGRCHPAPSRSLPSLARILPVSAVGSAAVSLLITVPLGFALAILGARILTNYGWGIFVAIQAVTTFSRFSVFNASWEERKVKEYMDEDRG